MYILDLKKAEINNPQDRFIRDLTQHRIGSVNSDWSWKNPKQNTENRTECKIISDTYLKFLQILKG